MTTFNSSDDGLVVPNKRQPEQDDSRLLKIKKLKAKLINEEHRLVLMKKIRQSQTRPINQQQQQPQAGTATNQSGATNLNNNINNNGALNVKKLRPSHSGVGGGGINLQQKNHLSSAALAGAAGSPAPGGSSSNLTPAHAHQRPKVNTLWNPPQQARHPPPIGIAPPHVGNLSRQPITTPPNVVQAMIGSLAAGGSQSLLMNQINAAAAQAARNSRLQSQQSAPPQQTSSSSSYNKSQAAQMLLQKSRSSLKPSIQRQLEQTLMQQQQSQKHLQQQQSSLGFGLPTSNLNKRSSVGGISSPHVGNLSRQPITTPPNVVQDMRSSLSGQQSLLMNANNLQSGSSRRPQQQQASSPFNKSQAAQMLLQKRTAAKQAIQKQLEQTLTQLPQKHIQVGIDFIPNANNIEFVYYVGLEACVDYLTGTKNPLDIQPLEKPFECSTCGTDFTPNWSWKRSNAVCENCVSEHVKKSIKNSQTSRIKSVLAKAAKQEQEMEQRIMAEATNVVSSSASPTSSASQQHSLLQPTSHHNHQPQQQPRSVPQSWPRISNSSPLSTSNTNRLTNVQPPVVNQNPLAGVQPAALASLLQMNPQLSTLASIMTANQNTNNNTNTTTTAATNNNNIATNNNSNTNQFAQVAALLMNQLTMNLWRR